MTVGPPTDRYWLLAARTTTAIALLVMLTACGQENRYVAPPPPKVTVAFPAQQKGVGELRVIESGLKPEDRVVVAGILRAIPGQKVDPQPQTVASAPSPPASGK